MTRIETILHPTDFSKNSEHAFQLACSLARDHGARLILLHVQETLIPVATEVGPAPLDLAEERKGLQERLKALRPEDPRIAVKHCIVAGGAAEEIVSLAHEEGCDLIVMGTHGRTGLCRLLMGSVAEEVIRKSPCPVLAVKCPPSRVEEAACARKPATTGDLVFN
jgi:nucleotide-binding universal stress UspA family protein